MKQAPPPDALLVPVGGGGLAAGCATLIKQTSPAVKVIGVEPASGDDTARSLREGRRVMIRTPATIADGLAHTTPSPGPFAINQQLLDDVVTVHDSAIAEAMALCLQHLRVIVEPSGACALAALVAGLAPADCGRIAVVLSGGNVDWRSFRALIDRSQAKEAQWAVRRAVPPGSARQRG